MIIEGIARVGDATGLDERKRCPLGCHGVHLLPIGSCLTLNQIAEACFNIQKTLQTTGQNVGIHVRVRDAQQDQFQEVGVPYRVIDPTFVEKGPAPIEGGSAPIKGESAPIGGGSAPVEGEFVLRWYGGNPADVEYAEATVCFYSPGSHTTKEDCWLLARHRRLGYTGPALWKMSLPEMYAVLQSPLTPVELAYLGHEQEKRRAFLLANPDLQKLPVGDIKKRLLEKGQSSSVGITKGGMFDMLQKCANVKDNDAVNLSDLDELQSRAVDLGLEILKGGDFRELLISAGPGSGKTTTLINFLAKAVTHYRFTRILVLAFNVEAEATLRRRLTRHLMGEHGIIPKTKVADRDYCGCAILTFDKMAYQVCNTVASTGRGEADPRLGALAGKTLGLAAQTYRSGKEQAARLLQTSSASGGIKEWDLIVVDEGQDVTPLEANIVEGLLMGRRPHHEAHPGLIVAGDPRQEVYSGAVWYAEKWHKATSGPLPVGPGGQPSVATHVLAYNYRSSPTIVKALNAYSKAMFPTLHHDQIPARTDPEEEVPIRIVEVGWLGSSVDTNAAIGQQVGSILASTEPGESYGLVPVTLERFKTDAATAAARQTLYELRPGDYTIALTGNSKIPDGGVYVLSTARRVKGTERKLVVLYAADRDYDLVVDHAAMKKLLYVALSRARDSLVIVTQILDSQRIKEYMAPFILAAKSNLKNSGGASVVTATLAEAPRKLKLTPVSITGESLPNGATGMGICQIPYSRTSQPWIVTSFRIQSLPPIGDELVQMSQADFIGILAEAYLALGIQIAWERQTGQPRSSPLADPKLLDITVDRKQANHGLYTKLGFDGVVRYVLCTSEANRDQLEQMLRDTVALGSSVEGAAAPYLHAMLRFTALCGRPWTVSASLSSPALTDLLMQNSIQIGEKLLVMGAGLLGVGAEALQPPIFWLRGATKMGTCRPGDLQRPIDHHKGFANAEISYETDVIFQHGGRSLPLELKHTCETSPEHERQLFSYMMLLEHRGFIARGLLYNSRSGELLSLETNAAALGAAVLAAGMCPEPTGVLPSEDPLDLYARTEFMCRARTLLAVRTARSAQLLHLAKHAIRPPAILAGHTTAIVVDTENDEKGNFTEIGAIAVSLTDWSVLDTFQQRAPSMAPFPPGRSPAAEGPTGEGQPHTSRQWVEGLVLMRRTFRGRISDRGAKKVAIEEGCALSQRFQAWCREVTTSNPVFIHWGGSEKNLVGADALMLDVHSACFKPWLELRGTGRRSDTSLSCALQQLLPQLPFAPHQAFEDALATLSVLLATVDFGGKL